MRWKTEKYWLSFYFFDIFFRPQTLSLMHLIHLSSSVRRFAAEALVKGLNELSRPQVASALEVFHNLACLPEQTKVCSML